MKNLLKKYILPIIIIILGIVLNAIFMKFVFNPILPILRFLLTIIGLEDTIFDQISELLVCIIFAIISVKLVLFFIYKINNSQYIPLIDIIIPILLNIWSYYTFFMSTILTIKELWSESELTAIYLVIILLTTDIVYFILLFLFNNEKKSLKN